MDQQQQPQPQIRFKEKSVIIHRDEHGFGLRVGGQNPVFVDFVHENGAAWKAGVRSNDLIIKVNGTLVRSYDHQRVVQMIQNCSPFVNLTLHSPETVVNDIFSTAPNVLQSTEPNTSGLQLIGQNNNSLHQRIHHPHPHSIANNLNWLLDIGDDLFQDNHQKQQQHQQNQINNELISITPNHQSVGVSKLIVSGPSPLTSNSNSGAGGGAGSGGKLDHRHTRNQTNSRDNPYYYYKTVADKNPEASMCNSSSTSHDQGSSKASTSLSMTRSRSSSKMSIRSTSGKFKPRNLRSRLVEDLRSLTITNSQTTPSSLSTSPSSSDLSDCDQDSSRLDCLTLNSSNLSTGTDTSQDGQQQQQQQQPQHQQQPQNRQQHQQVRSKVSTRRLEIIRELVDTEKTHTEKLKQLNDLLYKPIKAEGLVPPDQLKMVFSCHKSLLKIHRQIYKKLLAAQQNLSEHHQEPLVGRALIEIFDGDLGRRLEKAASTFCACQSTNTDVLNRVTRKDTKAGEFLAQVANQQMLGRLGIKDLLASCFQRLTKYPLLLDNLLKATPVTSAISGGIHSKSLSEGAIAITLSPQVAPPTVTTTNDIELDSEKVEASGGGGGETSTATSANEEYAYERICIDRALNLSRQILIHVNEAVNRAIAQNKLKEIWKKTDKNPSLPVIDIELQQLLHEGPLTLRLSRRTFEVYVLLLTHYLVILTREGQDKYKLKYFTSDGKSATQFSPIFNIDEHLAIRDSATDENGFYLLCKRKDDDARIYEFASQSPPERAKWKDKIHMAQSYNYSAPDDDNTLTRYTELISLANSSYTPNNIEHSPTTNSNNMVLLTSSSNTTGLNDINSNCNQSNLVAAKATSASETTLTSSTSGALTTALSTTTAPSSSSTINQANNNGVVQAQDS